jgi:hypothetical protein
MTFLFMIFLPLKLSAPLDRRVIAGPEVGRRSLAVNPAPP